MFSSHNFFKTRVLLKVFDADFHILANMAAKTVKGLFKVPITFTASLWQNNAFIRDTT